MSFANLRIGAKLAALCAAFALILLVLGTAVTLKSRDTTGEITTAAEAAEALTHAARIHQEVLAIAIERYRLTENFSAAEAARNLRETARLRASVADALRNFEAIAGPKRLAALAQVREPLAAFNRTLDAALAVVADAERSNDFSAAMRQRYVTAAEPATAQLGAVRAALRGMEAASKEVAVDAEAAAQSDIAQLELTIVLVSLAGLAATILLGWLIGSRAIGRPLGAAAERLRSLADGDTDSAIPFAARRDEVGDIAGAMAVFREKLVANRAMQDAAVAEAATKAARADRVAALTRGFEAETAGVVKAVAAAATEMEATASAMAGGAEATARQAGTVRNAAGEASANVQQVAAAAEELASSVGEITRQMAESSRMAAEAVNEAGRTREAVQSLSDKASRIGEVVRLISEIAAQTNLLALNATIEAARAGEAGKGFAVVASEVKSLAAQTGRATEEIAGQIQAVQGETARVVAAIGAVGQVIERINEIATAIAAAVEEQGAATAEIARNVNQAAQGTGTVTASIAGVDEAAAQSGAAATQVQAAARELSRGAEALRGQIDRFLEQMRAA
ncbi:methyl-accepting chemotaxis protein [Falsiroseomonas bella]|uniref:Methyl-accepting chemotaxis protein n=1 Tax=Falsiroseomonas bella TaxID=2184016 RepID=A0A317F9M9_9PROT|nr:methyl-accepting chemotaxis protein [Falsiroseomonas bella]PWS34727.1 methyl-accepting chemotaxis protein [Falsiroseomonas bella]